MAQGTVYPKGLLFTQTLEAEMYVPVKEVGLSQICVARYDVILSRNWERVVSIYQKYKIVYVSLMTR